MQIAVSISILCLSVLLLSGTAMGQIAPDTSITLPDVQVKEREQEPSKNLQLQGIEAMPGIKSHPLAESISAQSPVFVKSYGHGSVASISFRGTQSGQNKVHWQGVAINACLSGDLNLNLLSNTLFDSVSIAYGAATQEHGSGILGADIRTQNNFSQEKGLSTEWGANIGSFGTFQADARLEYNSKSLSAKVSAFNLSSRNDFPFVNTAEVENPVIAQEHASYRRGGISSNLRWREEHWQLAIDHMYLQSKSEVPRLMSALESGIEENLGEGLQVFKFSGEFALSSSLQHALSAWMQSNETEYLMRFERDSLSHTFHDNALEARTLGMEYRNEYEEGEKWQLSFGARAAFQRGIADYLQNFETLVLRRGMHTAFAGFSYRLNPQIEIVGRVRFQTQNFEQYAKNFSISTSIQPFENSPTMLLLSYSKKRKFPSLNDLYWQPGGNPELLPEELQSIEINIHTPLSINDKWHCTLQANLHYSRIENWIQWTPGANLFWSAQNIGIVYTQGVEFTGKSQYHLGEIRLKNHLLYTWNRTENFSRLLPATLRGSQLIYVPEHKFTLSQGIAYKKWQFDYRLSYLSERYVSPSSESSRHRLPAYALHNLHIGKTLSIGGVELQSYLSIDNLLDHSYQSILWRAMPGRSYTIRIELSL